MKKLFWMAGLMMLAACSSQEMPTDGLPEVETGRTVVAKATLPGGESRLALTEVDGKTIKVDWKESGETFSVMTATSDGDPVTFTQTTGNEFTGTLPDDWTGPYYAFYPKRVKDENGNYLASWCIDEFGLDPVTTVSADKVPFDLLYQTGKLEDLSPLMMAESEDGENYAFEHLTAIVKLTLTGMEDMVGKPVMSVMLQGLNTGGYYNLKTKEITPLKEFMDGELGVQTTSTDLLVAEDGSVSVYLCLPPVSKETPLLAGVVVKGEGEEQYHEYFNTNVALTQDLEAGKYYRVEREVKTMEEILQEYNFTVDSPEGLMEFAKASNENNMGFPMYLTLTADIDMSGQTWTPINQEDGEYQMSIDGGGHTISNLTVNGGEDGYCGFIAKLNEGSIVQNLHFENIHVTGDASGGIVGLLIQDAQIVGCSVSGQVTGRDYAAGIVAYNARGVIGCCLNAATVTTGTSNTYGGGISAVNDGEILGCINTGNVTGGHYCGAIVGYNTDNAEVSKCYWSGTMAAGIGGNNNTALESDATAIVEDWNVFDFSDLNSLLEEIGIEFVVDTGTDLPKLQKKTTDE